MKKWEDQFRRKIAAVATAESLLTPSGRAEGERRVKVMRDYLTTLEKEIFSSQAERPRPPGSGRPELRD